MPPQGGSLAGLQKYLDEWPETSKQDKKAIILHGFVVQVRVIILYYRSLDRIARESQRQRRASATCAGLRLRHRPWRPPWPDQLPGNAWTTGRAQAQGSELPEMLKDGEESHDKEFLWFACRGTYGLHS